MECHEVEHRIRPRQAFDGQAKPLRDHCPLPQIKCAQPGDNRRRAGRVPFVGLTGRAGQKARTGDQIGGDLVRAGICQRR